MGTPLELGAVVVGLDGSEQSLVALDWAIHAAQMENRDLLLLHAHGRREAGGEGSEVLAAGQRRVEELGRGLVVRTEEVDGSGTSALIGASRHAAMVCIGTHGRGGYLGTMLGSTALAVAASARCPVAIVPTPELPARPTRRIVVGVDESVGCRDAIGFAFSQAHGRQLRLTAVHGWRGGDPFGLRSMGTSPEKWRVETEWEQAALAESMAGWSEKYPDVEVGRVSIRKSPAAAILTLAADAALVVLGSRHPRPRPDLFGSPTIREVLSGTTCPVVVVPQPSA